jgi:hypothetical protein
MTIVIRLFGFYKKPANTKFKQKGGAHLYKEEIFLYVSHMPALV